VIKALSVVYIELVRSVPLITLMFMATTMFPLLAPKGVELNKLALAIISVCMFAAAYMAETVRGGIQAVPLGQMEAAQAMGMRYWRSMGLVILPQALRAMIPNIVGAFIELFKGTAVISIFGFYDLTNMLGAISQSPRWIMLFYEPIVVGVAIYFIGCFAMSRYSLYLERRLGVNARR
jgi:general L-amino acid transport system permease protein